MSLTELECKNAKGAEKKYTLSDGKGLLLEVRPNGKKYWIVRYWIKKKEHRTSLGPYPEVSLKDARNKNYELRLRLTRGEDIRGGSSADSFHTVAMEWYKKKISILSPRYAKQIKQRMERHILPFLGKMTISDVSMQHILAVCRPLEEDGSLEMCRRIRQILGQVFHYALVTGRIKADPSVALDGAFHAPSVNHHATMTNPDDIGDLLRHINAYRSPVVRLALKFSILTICRPGEIRYAEWKEIDFEKAEWKIPPEKMKMKRPHIVPLATQTIEVLDELKILTGDGRYLFPSLRSRERPISSETMRVALRSMGYRKDEITPHGFRAMASTILNENGFMPDVIERQLAHVEKNKVRAAYNHAEYLDQRREMLQWWGNWLLELKHL